MRGSRAPSMPASVEIFRMTGSEDSGGRYHDQYPQQKEDQSLQVARPASSSTIMTPEGFRRLFFTGKNQTHAETDDYGADHYHYRAADKKFRAQKRGVGKKGDQIDGRGSEKKSKAGPIPAPCCIMPVKIGITPQGGRRSE